MSTDPGPTRKADGSSDASVDEIAELLVEDESATREAHPQVDQALDDSLDVMLETPGPAAVGTFMPPPPLLPNATDENSSETEDRENAEEGVGQSNLAYEDLLAKLVLPSEHDAEAEPRPPAPEPSLPAIEPLPSAPAPEAVAAPAEPTPNPLPVFTPAPTPAPAVFDRPSSSMPLAASSTDERTLVTENPLLAEEQEAAAREGRIGSRDEAPRIQETFGSMASGPAPLMATASATRTKMMFFIAGNLAMLLCMVVAVLVFKIFIQAPASPPAVIMPAAVPLPPPAPPAKVEPLPSPPPAAAAVPVAPPATPEPAAVPPAENSAATEEATAAVEAEAAKPAPKAHRPTVHKAAHAPKPAPVAPAAKPAPAAKAAPAPVAKPAKAAAPAKKAKTGGYADPFDN